MPLKGIDISSHQGNVDFAAIWSAGYRFVIIKVTGGTRYINPYWQTQLAGALAHGFLVGLYHYDGEPSVGGGTAEQEAAFFLANLPNPLPANCLLALDAEERSTRNPQRYLRWIQLVEDGTSTRPLFYTYPSFVSELPVSLWRGLAYYTELWLASYDNPPLKTVAPWSEAVIVQTSGGSAVPGTTSPTDLNEFNQDRDHDGDVDLADLATLGTRPAPIQIETAISKDAPVTVTPSINAAGEPCLLINFRGKAKDFRGYVVVDAGVTVTGSDGQSWSRSVKIGQDLPWHTEEAA